MAKKKRKSRSVFRTSVQDMAVAHKTPFTPQTKSAAFRLAFDDPDFLTSEELRPVRLELEMLKPELALQKKRIKSTTVLFGGARIPAPGQKPWAAQTEIAAKNLTQSAKYYQEALEFAKLSSQYSLKHRYKEFVVVTGGGLGVMEAGNKGAKQVGAPSIGLNIVLPHEQAPNEYITPELCFNFHYFATRKIQFLLRAKVIAVFPGGFGTLDEFFETLTLIQTGRMERIPVLLFGKKFWKRIINLEALAEEGTISPQDLDLFEIVDEAQQGWDIVKAHYDLDKKGHSPNI